MKRRVLSLVIALTLCLNLCPTWALAAAVQSDTIRDGSKFTDNVSVTSPHVVSGSVTIDTDVYTLTAPSSTAIRVTGTGALDLRGRVISKRGSGVEVETGGSLRITESGTVINSVGGYGLDIASGATVYLSAGRYTGTSAAIRTADNNFASLLAEGCAYFADDGTPILDIEMATVVNVGPCAHSEKSYTHTSGETVHAWACPYCGAKGESEKCTFTFDQNGAGICACGNKLTIVVDEQDLTNLVYDGTVKPEEVKITVTLTDGSNKELVKDTDYRVNYEPRIDAGEITVTVEGITFKGTFTKTYRVQQDQPGIKWDEDTKELDYDGSRTTIEGDLPHITITIAASEDLHQYLQYSYRKVGETDFTDGLPLNAGVYEVKAYLEESQNYKAAETDPCLTLTIKKISALITAPEPTEPTYDRNSHELITAGTAHEGTVIEYAQAEDGPYSTDIPTGIDAGSYDVWYRIADTENYTGITATKVDDVIIQPKEITPTVEVSERSYVYDGTQKDPKITVKDENIVIDSVGQYTVTWAGTEGQSILRDVDTYTATIKSVATGNYTFETTATVEIVNAAQGGLTITGQPAHVYYGDKITTLNTTGGTGNGEVKWSITAGGDSAEIVEDTGVLTVKGTGSVTVKAERVVPNYGTVSNTWTFNVEPKPVLAEVTVAPKAYDGNTTANITAAIKAGDLVASTDSVPLNELTGTYDTANAGTGKTVTLNDAGATKADGNGKYAVSYPATVTGDINPRNVAVTVTLSGNDLKTDTDGNWYYDYNGTDRTPTVTVKAKDDNAVLVADSDYSVTYTNNKNVSTADAPAVVTVKAKTGGNYTFDDAEVKFAIRNASAVLTQSPPAKDLTYTGQLQDLVGVGTATGGTVVYSDTNKDDPDSYSETIPQGTDAGTYTVYYKVKGDANHSDTTPGQVSVTIKPKPITPAITLEQDSCVYDGTAHEPAVTVKDGTDTVDTSEYTVSYRDNINAGTATVTVSNNNSGNYIVDGTANFTITKAAPTVTPPEAKTTLQYNGEKQDLVNAGVTGHGTVKYSVNGGNYTTDIPSASAVGTYTIDWMVKGDANHEDTTPATLTVEIGKNQVTNPTITLSSDEFKYTGSQQKPVITVCDDGGCLIPEHEYTVTITGTKSNNMVDVDVYTVKITTPGISDNYEITNDGTVNVRTFKIVPADQETISITGTKAQVYYGEGIQLGTTGGTGEGTLTWEVTAKDGSTITSTISSTGLLTVQDVGGPYTVKVTRTIANYGDVSASWEFSAAKKPVTAVLTANDRSYAAGDKTVTVTAAVPDSLLVTGDSIEITGLTGMFDSDSVGTGKKVMVDLSKKSITGTNSDKYDVTIPATTTASILAVAATVDAAPEANTLTYDASQSQTLVTAGAATGGTMVYSLDGTNFTANIPQAKDAGSYTVYYKAQGDQNHTDSVVDTVDVTIAQQTVTKDDIQIEISPPSAQYDGEVKRPQVTVRDKANNVIPTSEYKVTYVEDGGANWKDQGTYTVKIENIAGGNYTIETATADFEINTSPQAPLEIVNKPGQVYYGDTFTLSAVGGSASGQVTWSSSDASIADIDANGFVTIKGVGSATITATKAGGGNYDEATATYPLNAKKKPVTAIVSADDREYRENDVTATIHVTWKDGDLINGDTIQFNPAPTGTFGSDAVGTSKQVTVTATVIDNATSQKYDITLPPTTTASILKADAAAPNVTAVADLEYDGTAQFLVTDDGTDTNTRYSDSRNGVYSATVPTGTNAGTYTVWYKAAGDGNHNDSAPQSIQVTISPKTLTANANNVTLSGSDLETDTSVTPNVYYYLYDGTDKTPTVTIKDGSAVVAPGEYTVSYSNHKNVGTNATVTITDNAGGNYVVSGSVTFEIRKGGAQLNGSPQAVMGLTYTGAAQELVTVGTATGGHLEYSLDGNSYSKDIPERTEAGTYVVHYKVVGDDNHEDDTKVGSVTVTIKPKEVVSPKITVSGTYTYDGTEQKPAVMVEDDTKTIPDTEYILSYRDNVNAGTATVIVSDKSGGNYTVNGTATFEIAKAELAAADITAPVGQTDLPYNGTDQALAEAGSATGGTMVYSLTQDGEYIPAIPTGKAVDTYTVWYKVQGDGNHNDSATDKVEASIIVNTVSTPTVQVEPDSVKYTGEKQEPTVTVRDNSGLLIDGSEYTVDYKDASGNPAAPTAVGEYTLTITGKGTNYDFSGATIDAKFTITPADQTSLTITGKRERVYYGDTIQLAAEGGTEGGTVTWTVDDGSTVASIDADTGLLKITGVGSVTVTATSTGSNYKTQTATWQLYAEKKQVTAVVTATDRTYNGGTGVNLTVTISSGLVSGDDITGAKAEGHFTDKNVGENKTVVIESLTFPDNIKAKYEIASPATVTATIFKADIVAANVTAPTAAENLEYTGLAQSLVKPEAAGSSTDGTMEYSLDGKTYSASLPTGTDAGDYDVWYRVKGDGNHNDTTGTKLTNDTQKVTIAKQTVDTPTIEFNPTGASYDGQEHKPSVTVKDANNRVIPDSEYDVEYSATDWKSASTATVQHKVKVKNKTGGNYNITAKEQEFIILVAGQSPLSITNKPGTVRYGDSFTLSAVGGSIAGAVSWESSAPEVASIDSSSGRVSVHKSGSVTITAKRVADGNYGEVSDSWSFSVEKKPVTPIVTARDREYDPNRIDAELVITWKDGDLLKGDSITLNLTGSFNDANVGTNKTVTITGTKPDSDKYDVTIPLTTTASITPKAATVTGVTAKPNLVYSGSAQELVTAGTATGGTITYSLDGIVYGPNIPKGTNADSYTVWYKVTGSENYKDIAPAVVPVTIEPKPVNDPVIELSPDTFDYDGNAKKPDVVVKDSNVVIPESEYTVKYTDNTAVGTTATVTIIDAEGGNYTVSGSKTFTIKAGTVSLTNPPQAKDLTYNGFDQALVTPGTAVNGTVVYSTTQNGTYTGTIPTGKDANFYQVWYKAKGDGGETAPESMIVEIRPRQVTPVLTLSSNSLTYTGSALTPAVTVSVNGQTLDTGTYQVTYSNNTEPGTATVTVTSIGGNYQFTAQTTFTIAKDKATFALEPKGKTNLVYNGEPQELVSRGYSADGIVLYSTNATTYSSEVPTGTAVRDDYVVFAKVQGNSTHEDSDVVIITAEIGINEVKNPTVELSATSFPYTGSVQKPTITVSDDDGNVIAASEYRVTYTGDTINPGKYTLTIASRDKNYSFAEINREITITDASQTPLAITGKPEGTIYYGDILSLGTTGGGSGAVTWSMTGPVDKLGDGQYKVTNSGSVTITATKGSSTDTWTFYAKPKPVTAVVTAADKVYNGDNTVILTVTLNGLLSGETVSLTANGNFIDEKVGTNKNVLITGLNISDEVCAKYDVRYNSTTTASITPKPATVLDTDKPTLAVSLTYNGGAQPLLTNGGTADGGNLMYSLNGQDYSYTTPTGTDAKTYTVWYKVAASDENHKDSVPVKLGDVIISADPNTPQVRCNPSSFPYDGTEKTPAVVVLDSTGQHIIPESEYTVVFPTNAINKGSYTVTVKDKPGGNYQFSDVTGNFEIVASSQAPVSITDKPAHVYYGDTFYLSATGGSGSGAVKWSIAESSIATIDDSGAVTVNNIGSFTVKAYREASGGYSDSNTDSVTFVAQPKPVTPVVTASDKSYNGKTDAALTASLRSSDLVNSTDDVDLTASGVFASADAGVGKRVDLTGHSVAGTDAAKYAINWPDSVTATINRVDAKITGVPAGKTLTYTGSAQELVSAGTTENKIGTIVYSLNDQNGPYSEKIPTASDIGTYTVWYKVADSVNYTGIPSASVRAEIVAASSTPPAELPSAGLDNALSTPPASAPSAGETAAPVQAPAQDSAASATVSAGEVEQLVQEALENQSGSIVVKPDLSGDVTRAEVPLPAETVNRIVSADAPLTVSTPIADATIPQAALETLGRAGDVSVVTELVDRTVTLRLTAGGEAVESVPGGVTLSVPVEDAGPGTVAVLVHEDGTRETISKSMVVDGKMMIPLDGSATVEIVDNSKAFEDVPADSWASDAVAFASAREMFSGTGESTFSPDESMSRGMLATVLYNLEGRPEQDVTMRDLDGGYSDVDGDAWYADGVAWATENGIVNGYGNGAFGPDDSVTREQLAVMLWKYAGGPEASDEALHFTDADAASGYAQQALRWAVDSGILNGYEDGRLAPGGTATRAEAAQMLKNFMERA